ncbi:MAG TPA: hypothetical protein VGG29_00290 [Caulobacteraceae bacterium]
MRDPRVIAVGGGAAALAAGLLIAWAILAHSRKPTEAPPASQGGLVVVSGRDDDAKLDPKRPLRCFVGGQFVGELPLADCARRNGVATGALDVGLDPSGALAAATNGTGADITPLPSQAPPQAPPQSLPVTEAGGADAANAVRAPQQQLAQAGGQSCWRFAGAGWRELPASMPLTQCVQALYGGRCPETDDVYYGRWGEETLRLMGGRIEISSNNRDFAPLIDPWPPCQDQPG